VLEDHLRWFRSLEVSNGDCYREVGVGPLVKRLGYRLYDRVLRTGPQAAGEVCPLHSLKIASLSHRVSYVMVTECCSKGKAAGA
jgi:hypothetical protein